MKLENIALIIFLIGFFTLFLMYIITPPEELTLTGKLVPKEKQRYFFTAQIDSIKKINGTTYASIETTFRESIIIPKIQSYLTLEEGQNIEIEATITKDEAKDKHYLEIKEIRLI